MRAVISVANVAARSGKTTVAVNLAAEFAGRGIRTLLVDADPQAHATRFFIKPEEVIRTLADVLLPRTRPATERHAPIWDVFSPASFPHLGVVAGGTRLAVFETLESARATDLRARLGFISDFHDVAIFDTPSSLALLMQACLRASTHVLASVSPSTHGEAGLRLIAEYVDNMTCDDEPPELWVMCNRFDCRARASGQLYERLKVEWGERVYDTIIHRDDMIETCSEHRRPVMASAPQSPAADLYARLADEVLGKLDISPIRQVNRAGSWWR